MHQGSETGKLKAVGLLSGGLDSTLAAQLMLEQGIEVYAINFTSPFCTCTPKKAGCAAVITAVKGLGGVKLKQVALRDEYLEMVRDPRHGYGSEMNPCIDCRIMKIHKAGKYMRKIGAAFLFTGEVMGQRPMSQRKAAIELIDRESGYPGYILRPLSARHFDPTVPELKGWVDRSKLLAISGRSRKIQISLAAEKGIRDYPCPTGGCLLTDKNFAGKLRDYFDHTPRPRIRDIALLKIGRHFRLADGGKIIVARNQQECKILENLSGNDSRFLVPLNFKGPSVLLHGNALEEAVAKMLHYTSRRVPDTVRITHNHRGKETVIIREKVHEQQPHKSCGRP
jgi:tRNA U34 2-thiouridine synthase MnmA/TrmU